MGRPHPTVDVPGPHPGVGDELSGCDPDPEGFLDELRRGLDHAEAEVVPGHVCATGWILDPTGSQMLLVRHHRLGWASPGGHVHPEESVRDAVWREVAEETGLTAPRLELIGPGPFTVHVTDTGEPDHRHWNIAYLFGVDTEAPLRPEHDAGAGGAGELAWFSLDEAIALAGVHGPADLAIVTPRARDAFRTRRRRRL